MMLKQPCCLLPHGATLLSILVATSMLLIHSSSAQDTFSGMQESYAVYPGWSELSAGRNLLELTFTTSSGSGPLVYAEGESTEALAVMLDGGSICVNLERRKVRTLFDMTLPTDETQLEQFCISSELNDNRPHTISIQWSPGRFTVSVLDRMASKSSEVIGTSSEIGSTKVYIGSLPNDRTSLLATSGSFRGCLEDIKFSTSASSLVDVTPLEQEGVVEGCLSAADLCANVSCGAGTCVAVLPESYYCDCSSTPLGGANCNEGIIYRPYYMHITVVHTLACVII